MDYTTNHIPYESIVATWDEKEFPYTIRYSYYGEYEINIGKNAKIGRGVLLLPETSIYNATIGDGCIIDGHVLIEDEVVLHDNVKIGTRTHLWERVEIGSDSRIGSSVAIDENTTVLENIRIPSNMTIGPNLIVVKNPIFIIGSRHPVFWISETKVKIGCNVFSIDGWLKHYQSIGCQYGYTEEEIEEYLGYLKLLKEQGPPYVRKGGRI